jgi:hypothetical protein
MDNTGRDGEETLFDIIRSSMGPVENDQEDDGSQYLNNIGDGMIFDEDKERDEDDDDEGNVDLQISKTGEVYIYIRHLVIITFLN